MPLMYDQKDCIDALQDCAKELGKSPSRPEYMETDHLPSHNTIVDRFGTWNKAKEAADLEKLSLSKSVKVDYFEKIDTPRKAYWMGLFFADGFVSDGRFGIKLVESDGYLIEQLKEDLESEHTLSVENPENPNWNRTVRLEIRRSDFVSHFSSHGLDGEKTRSSSLPELDDELKPHFVRGMFDGDGHITYDSENGPTNCRITGISPGRFEAMSEWIPVDVSIYHRCDGVVDLSIKLNDRAEFFNYLYPDGSETEPKLVRKYCTFKQYV